jgi:hypothetical protein
MSQEKRGYVSTVLRGMSGLRGPLRKYVSGSPECMTGLSDIARLGFYQSRSNPMFAPRHVSSQARRQRQSDSDEW